MTAARRPQAYCSAGSSARHPLAALSSTISKVTDPFDKWSHLESRQMEYVSNARSHAVFPARCWCSKSGRPVVGLSGRWPASSPSPRSRRARSSSSSPASPSAPWPRSRRGPTGHSAREQSTQNVLHQKTHHRIAIRIRGTQKSKLDARSLSVCPRSLCWYALAYVPRAVFSSCVYSWPEMGPRTQPVMPEIGQR